MGGVVAGNQGFTPAGDYKLFQKIYQGGMTGAEAEGIRAVTGELFARLGQMCQGVDAGVYEQSAGFCISRFGQGR